MLGFGGVKVIEKMNVQLATGEQALVRLRRIERPTSNIEWEKMKKRGNFGDILDYHDKLSNSHISQISQGRPQSVLNIKH